MPPKKTSPKPSNKLGAVGARKSQKLFGQEITGDQGLPSNTRGRPSLSFSGGGRRSAKKSIKSGKTRSKSNVGSRTKTVEGPEPKIGQGSNTKLGEGSSTKIGQGSTTKIGQSSSTKIGQRQASTTKIDETPSSTSLPNKRKSPVRVRSGASSSAGKIPGKSKSMIHTNSTPPQTPPNNPQPIGSFKQKLIKKLIKYQAVPVSDVENPQGAEDQDPDPICNKKSLLISLILLLLLIVIILIFAMPLGGSNNNTTMTTPTTSITTMYTGPPTGIPGCNYTFPGMGSHPTIVGLYCSFCIPGKQKCITDCCGKYYENGTKNFSLCGIGCPQT